MTRRKEFGFCFDGVSRVLINASDRTLHFSHEGRRCIQLAYTSNVLRRRRSRTATGTIKDAICWRGYQNVCWKWAGVCVEGTGTIGVLRFRIVLCQGGLFVECHFSLVIGVIMVCCSGMFPLALFRWSLLASKEACIIWRYTPQVVSSTAEGFGFDFTVAFVEGIVVAPS